MFSASPPWRSSGKKTDKKQSYPKFSSGRIFALYSDKNQKCPKLVIYKNLLSGNSSRAGDSAFYFQLSQLCQSLQLKRAGIEAIVCALFGDELFMVAALDYSAVVEHHYDIRVLDGREAVRDNKDRAPFHQLIHAALDESLGARIYRRCRLVEDHDGWVGDRRAGYRYQLTLTLRSPEPSPLSTVL